MLTKVIKYKDYDGNEREETHYFNLSRAELIKLNATNEGGLEAVIKRLTSERDSKNIYEMFEMIVMLSYGIKSLDGKRLEKSREITKEFMETEAYSELIVELFSGDGKNAADFINSIIPKQK